MSSTTAAPTFAASPTGTVTALDPRCTAAGFGINIELTTPATFHLTSPADVDALSNCTVLYGDVSVRGQEITVIDLRVLENIVGGFDVSSCSQIANLSAPVLSYIGGNFTLSNLPLLTNVDLPALSGVNGSTLRWDALPKIESPIFNSLAAFEADKIIISNTSLTGVSFINFTAFNSRDHPLNTLQIIHNPFMGIIDLPGLTIIDALLEVSNNGPRASIHLPDLIRSRETTFSDLGEILLPSVHSIRGTLTLTNNDFPIFSVPSLTTLGKECYGDDNCRGFFVSNNTFAQMILSNLSGISGDATITNNLALQVIDFPTLLYAGDITIIGDLTEVSMSSLTTISETFIINSTNPSAPFLDCSYFDELNYQIILTSQDVNGQDYIFSCQDMVPGTSKDLAIHFREPFRLSKAGQDGVIAISVILGFFVFLGVIWRARHKPRSDQSALFGGNTEAGGNIPLEYFNRPPPYRRTGVAGEVPPRYLDTRHDSETESERPPTPVNPTPPRYPER